MSTYHTATYSPEDDKLRLYPAHRLDHVDYERVKAHGFRWAPKQELFFVVWSPGAEDLCLEMAGEIGDEDKSLAQRAEERADRFDGYSANRERDAKASAARADQISERFYGGQPILVGHHSERQARRDQKRMHDAMSTAVRMWDQSGYWKARAACAVAAAEYKERPDVRARRIKGLESDRRGYLKHIAEVTAAITRWQAVTRLDNDPEAALRTALAIANYDHLHFEFPLADYPRDPPASQYEGSMGIWSALDGRVITPSQAAALTIPTHERGIAHHQRSLAHVELRLEYERAMLAEQGGSMDSRFDIQPGGQVFTGRAWLTVTKVNRGAEGRVVSVTAAARGGRGILAIERVKDYRPPTAEEVARVKAATAIAPLANYPGEGFVAVTEAEWKAYPKDYQGTVTIEPTDTVGRHRVRHVNGVFIKPRDKLPGWADARTETERYNVAHRWWNLFVTDAKTVQPPAPTGDAAVTLPEPVRVAPAVAPEPPPAAEDSARFDAMKAALRGRVAVHVVPNLFPTPAHVAAEVVRLADIHPGHRLLEPSAGTGNLLRAVGPHPDVMAIEINLPLCNALEGERVPGRQVIQADFLTCQPESGDFAIGTFDRIVMNPPFERGADIKHIRHALGFLRPGGRLVSICAAGPRQARELWPMAARYKELPADTFKDQGTSVRTAILVIDAARLPQPAAIAHAVPAPRRTDQPTLF